MVNSAAIAAGGIIGVVLKKGISEEYKETIMDGVALSIMVLGVINAIKTDNIILMISSLVIGGFIGETISVEKKLDKFGDLIQSKIKNKENGFVKGFVPASLIFCVGAMAIIGSLEAGIIQNYETLYAKAILEGISAIVFATTLGIGVVFSAIPVFIYQGIITLLAANLSDLLTVEVINEISAVGGVLIIGIGLSLLNIKKIKVGNLLPGIFIPLVFFFLKNLIK